MSMSTHVQGFKPPDEKWAKMRAIFDACEAAHVDVPLEVERFFGDNPPDPDGVLVAESDLRAAGAVTDWSGEYAEGLQVDITKLPADVTVVRFQNRW
jgi:hypothetical protein